MNRTISLILCLWSLLSAHSNYAQLPECDKIYLDHLSVWGFAPTAAQIYTYDPASPVSAANPSLNTIAFPAGWNLNGGLTVSRVLGSTSLTRTFYTVEPAITRRIWFYDPVTLTWVNTGHTMGNPAAVNLGAGGGYMYGLVGATGQVYKYDGTGNGTLLITVNDFINEGPYDLIADCDGNFYIFNASGNNNPPFLKKYDPDGVLLQSWTLNNTSNASPSAGFAIAGNTFYTDDLDPGVLYFTSTVAIESNIVGISQLNIPGAELRITPNPAHDNVVIINQSQFRMEQIQVFDINGRLVYNEDAQDAKRHALKTGSLYNGIYMVKIITDKGIVMRKLQLY